MANSAEYFVQKKFELYRIEKLKTNIVVQNLAKEHNVSLDRIDELKIEIVKLEKKYAETDVDVMKINKSLFDKGLEYFLNNYFFVVVHEIVHWMTRIRESDSYFNDPEEVLGFCASIAYEIANGLNEEEIYNKIYPEISWHFNNESDAKEFFLRSFEKAKKILNISKRF